MPKYKLYVQKMIEDNTGEFDAFRKLHELYESNENKWQDKFNSDGEKILEIVREYENRLCRDTERGMYNKFSSGLAEKFQEEVRRHFPLIDRIGIHPEPSFEFEIKKISL